MILNTKLNVEGLLEVDLLRLESIVEDYDLGVMPPTEFLSRILDIYSLYSPEKGVWVHITS